MLIRVTGLHLSSLAIQNNRELPDGYPALIAMLALEALDFVVDSIGQGLISSPIHGGENILELY